MLGRRKERQLIARRGRRRCTETTEPCTAAGVRALQLAQDLTRARYDRGRQTGEAANLDAVRAVGAARLKSVQEDDVVPDLAHRDIEVDQCVEQIGKLCQLVIVCRED